MKSPALVPISVHDQKPSLEIGEKALGVKLLQLECCSFLPTRYSFGQSKAYLVSVKDYILNCFCRSICHQKSGCHSLQEYLVNAHWCIFRVKPSTTDNPNKNFWPLNLGRHLSKWDEIGRVHPPQELCHPVPFSLRQHCNLTFLQFFTSRLWNCLVQWTAIHPTPMFQLSMAQISIQNSEG